MAPPTLTAASGGGAIKTIPVASAPHRETRAQGPIPKPVAKPTTPNTVTILTPPIQTNTVAPGYVQMQYEGSSPGPVGITPPPNSFIQLPANTPAPAPAPRPPPVSQAQPIKNQWTPGAAIPILSLPGYGQWAIPGEDWPRQYKSA